MVKMRRRVPWALPWSLQPTERLIISGSFQLVMAASTPGQARDRARVGPFAQSIED
jgi:hypothetical protein